MGSASESADNSSELDVKQAPMTPPSPSSRSGFRVLNSLQATCARSSRAPSCSCTCQRSWSRTTRPMHSLTAVLESGRLVQHGTWPGAGRAPASRFVEEELVETQPRRLGRDPCRIVTSHLSRISVRDVPRELALLTNSKGLFGRGITRRTEKMTWASSRCFEPTPLVESRPRRAAPAGVEPPRQTSSQPRTSRVTPPKRAQSCCEEC